MAYTSMLNAHCSKLTFGLVDGELEEGGVGGVDLLEVRG